jgi:hypothetical protein
MSLSSHPAVQNGFPAKKEYLPTAEQSWRNRAIFAAWSRQISSNKSWGSHGQKDMMRGSVWQQAQHAPP